MHQNFGGWGSPDPLAAMVWDGDLVTTLVAVNSVTCAPLLVIGLPCCFEAATGLTTVCLTV